MNGVVETSAEGRCTQYSVFTAPSVAIVLTAEEKGQKRVKKGAQVKGKPPLFVSAVLQTLWDIYEVIKTLARIFLCHTMATCFKVPYVHSSETVARLVLMYFFAEVEGCRLLTIFVSSGLSHLALSFNTKAQCGLLLDEL